MADGTTMRVRTIVVTRLETKSAESCNQAETARQINSEAKGRDLRREEGRALSDSCTAGVGSVRQWQP